MVEYIPVKILCAIRISRTVAKPTFRAYYSINLREILQKKAVDKKQYKRGRRSGIQRRLSNSVPPD